MVRDPALKAFVDAVVNNKLNADCDRALPGAGPIS
jgi:hypothetical protein